MLSLHGGIGRTWVEMTPQEQKIYSIVIAIIALGLITYGIYYFFKNKKDK